MLTDQSLRIVAGRLGYQVGVEETIEVFDSSSDGFVPETIIRPETVTGYFVVHLDEGWLMVEEIGSRLPTDNFIEILASFINEEMFYDSQRVTAQLLRVTESPWRFVSRVERVVSVTFSVTPSNPGKRWREMDEQLKKARARRLKERYENKEGLNVPSDDDESDAEENPIGLGIAMTLAGYGDPRELSIVGTFRSRPAEYDGGVGASLLFDEIAVQDASDREDPEQMLPRIIRVLDESVQVGVPFGWRRGSASEST